MAATRRDDHSDRITKLEQLQVDTATNCARTSAAIQAAIKTLGDQLNQQYSILRERLDTIERQIQLLHAEIYGNGGRGIKFYIELMKMAGALFGGMIAYAIVSHFFPDLKIPF